jgi:predicted SprT family Zn-dependent metalloprotease
MKQANEIQRAAYRILADAAERCPGYADTIRRIRVRISSRMTSCGGTANYRKMEIALPLAYFADETNFEKFLFEVVTHEAAHLVVGIVDRNRRPHGPQFKMVHRSMGGTGKRTHEMQLADGFSKRKAATRTSVFCGCGCGETITLGPTQYRKHLKGLRYVKQGHRGRVQNRFDPFRF